MGVLNVTPDSFSDGGLYLEPDAALRHAREMISAGAEIVDVGGESTRPGANQVSEEEELGRVLPVVERLVETTNAFISIDTRKPSVARKAVEAGASLINDTTGEPTDYEMDAVAAETGAAIVIMHSRGTPKSMRDLTDYNDVVAQVSEWLQRRAGRLRQAGVANDSIVVDPGIGFAKSSLQSLVLLQRIDEIVKLGYPVLIGTSRKSFIGTVLDLPENQRIEGTAATIGWAIARGVRITRVHDVTEMARVVRMTSAIMSASQ
jgi:dihydropteroate synthase